MGSFFSLLPKASEFFPPSPQAFKLLFTGFRWTLLVCSSFRARDLHRKPDLFHVQCIHSAIAHPVTSTFVMLALLSANHPNDAPLEFRVLIPHHFQTVRYSSMDSFG